MGTNFLDEGRAIISWDEARDFIKQVSERDQAFIINVSFAQIKLGLATRFKKIFQKHAPEYQATVGTIGEQIVGLGERLGYTIPSIEDGLNILCTSQSQDFKHIMASSNELNIAINSARMYEDSNCPIIADSQIISRYFTNKDVMFVPKITTEKRQGLNDTVFLDQEINPKRTSCDHNLQLDQKLESLQSNLDEIRLSAVNLIEADGNSKTEVLSMMEKYLVTASDDGVKICGLIRSISRETKMEKEALTVKLESGKKAREVLRKQMQEIQESYDGEMKQRTKERGDLQAKMINVDLYDDAMYQAKKIDDELKTKTAEVQNLHIEYQKRIKSKEEEIETFTEHHAQDNLRIVQMETRLHELERQKFETRAEIMSVKKERRNSWSATKNISLRNPMRRMENTPIRMSFGSSSEEESVETKSSRRNLIMHNDVESQANLNTLSAKNVKYAAITPTKFGMKTWEPLSCSFLDHLVRLEMGVNAAIAAGVEQKMIENLIIMTLPAEYNYVNEFHPPSERVGDLGAFRKKLVELIMGTSTGQASEFMCAQRKPSENVLSYFQRLRNLLLYSSGVPEKSLENDLWSIRMVYQKICAALNNNGVSELERLVEDKLDNGSLTYSELKKAVIKAARKIQFLPIQSEVMAVQNNASVVPRPSYFRENQNYDRERRCHYCRKPGHFIRDCRKRLNREQKMGESGETKEATEEIGRRDTSQA